MSIIEDAPQTVRVSPPEGPIEGTKSVRVTHTHKAVREARSTITSDLTARGVDRMIIDEAEAVVAEFVANSVIHARPLADGCVRVRWKVKSGAVEVEVRDGGAATTPKPVRRSLWAVRGRGLRIVRSMAHEWGVQDERNGRTVWAALGGPSRRRRL
ncbi:MAG: ATP-binding protein [Mobilicoccus sp.]|nr:ATP-binding protein [Mobilicoccus sp.]